MAWQLPSLLGFSASEPLLQRPECWHVKARGGSVLIKVLRAVAIAQFARLSMLLINNG